MNIEEKSGAYIDDSGIHPNLKEFSFQILRHFSNKESMKLGRTFRAKKSKIFFTSITPVKIDIMDHPRGLIFSFIKSLKSLRIKTFLSTFRTETRTLREKYKTFRSMKLLYLLSSINCFSSNGIKFSPSSSIFSVISFNFFEMGFFPFLLRSISYSFVICLLNFFSCHILTTNQYIVKLFIRRY